MLDVNTRRITSFSCTCNTHANIFPVTGVAYAMRLQPTTLAKYLIEEVGSLQKYSK